MSSTSRTLPARAAALPRLHQRVTPSGVVAALVVVVAVFLSVYPVLMLLRGSFLTGRIGQPGDFTLQNYVSIYGSATTYSLFLTTVLYAVGLATASVFVGFVLAWVAVRTNAPLARHMPWLVFIPYVLPNTLTSVAWILLANPNTGFLNEAARGIFGPDATPFNVYSFPGMVFVSTTHAFALAFAFMAASLHSTDPSLEEAASTSGASPLKMVLRVGLPLTWPAIFSTLTMLVILGLESFDVPAFIGIPANIRVFTTQIFFETSVRTPPDFGRAATYGVLPLLMALVLTYWYRRVVINPERFATVTGKAYRPRRIDLGPWRWVATGAFLAVFFITAVLPIATLLVVSVAPTLIAAKSLNVATFDFRHYATILNDPIAQRAMRNSVTIAVVGATVAIGLAFCLSVLVTRVNLRGRSGLEYLLFLPFALPSVVLAVGMLWGYVAFPIAVYGTIWILMIGYVTKFLPYGLRSVSNSLLQIHKELEEVARMSGAGTGQTLWRILAPLSLPGLVAGWSLLVVVFMREFSISLLLWSSRSEVITVLFYDYWTNGRFGQLAALGMLLIAVSLAIVFGVRRFTRLDTTS